MPTRTRTPATPEATIMITTATTSIVSVSFFLASLVFPHSSPQDTDPDLDVCTSKTKDSEGHRATTAIKKNIVSQSKTTTICVIWRRVESPANRSTLLVDVCVFIPKIVKQGWSSVYGKNPFGTGLLWTHPASHSPVVDTPLSSLSLALAKAQRHVSCLRKRLNRLVIPCRRRVLIYLCYQLP